MGYDQLRKGRYSAAHQVYFVTTVAQGRVAYFNDLWIGRCVVKELRYLHDEGFAQSMAWVLMPDHLYWLIGLEDSLDLGTVLKTLKARSARAVNKQLGRRGSIWQRAYYDHALRKDENLRVVARYILNNPLRAGLVTDIGEYSLWDAAWISNRIGRINPALQLN
ncbi:MAG TPA: transposase [Acidiferrobacteraceae bacterium]|nr:transposase [Acidiferrobacteraceae bacterium]